MINNVTLIGRLTKDLELRKTPNGKSTVGFILAVGRAYKKEGQQEADFIECVAWNQSADYLCSYAHKGSLVAIKGRIATRNYDGKNGKVYVTEVIADEVQLLESKPKETQQQTNNYAQPNYGYAPTPTPEPSYQETDWGGLEPNHSYKPCDISPDDLPFY